MATCLRTHRLTHTHTQLNHQRLAGVQLVGHTSINIAITICTFIYMGIIARYVNTFCVESSINSWAGLKFLSPIRSFYSAFSSLRSNATMFQKEKNNQYYCHMRKKITMALCKQDKGAIKINVRVTHATFSRIGWWLKKY